MDFLIKKPSAWIPIAISLTALMMVFSHVFLFGIMQNEDEGAPARIFQLLMSVQVLIVIFFGFKWIPQMPRQAVQILALQVFLALIPILLIIFLQM